jgi:hypothetical protein
MSQSTFVKSPSAPKEKLPSFGDDFGKFIFTRRPSQSSLSYKTE